MTSQVNLRHGPHAIRQLAAGMRAIQTVSGSRKASGSINFAGQPAANDTITINGTVFTFKASGAAGNQINIGADLTATVNAIVTALNASAVAGVALATYANVTNNSVSVIYDVGGLEGNAFALAKAGANITVSGATLAGGLKGDKWNIQNYSVFKLVTQAGSEMEFEMPDGEEGQEVTVIFGTKGAGANAKVWNTFASGRDYSDFTAADKFFKKIWINGAWRNVVLSL